MIFVTRILLSSDKTGKRKAVTPKEPVKIMDLNSYRKQVQKEYPEFDSINFAYYEETT